jgi:Raf kinase inhibitor-like YbhB/YbcL family protein
MPHCRLRKITFLALALAACGRPEQPPAADTLAVITDTGGQSQQIDHSAHSAMTFNLSSPAFPPNGSIPAKYTCEGADISPALEWAGAPSGTKTFALIVDDPDAPDPAKPQRVYVHWVVHNIPASTTKLPENAAKSGLPSGAAQGINDFGKQTYGGPCPPIGRHRYFFKLYALDTELTGLSKPNKARVEKAMQGHTIGNAQLIGTYQKAKP